jgi:hypothetical protein
MAGSDLSRRHGSALLGLLCFPVPSGLTRHRDPAGTLVSGAGPQGVCPLVVAGEAAAIPAGAVLLNGPAGLPHAVVAWVSVVVGVHFGCSQPSVAADHDAVVESLRPPIGKRGDYQPVVSAQFLKKRLDAITIG